MKKLISILFAIGCFSTQILAYADAPEMASVEQNRQATDATLTTAKAKIAKKLANAEKALAYFQGLSSFEDAEAKFKTIKARHDALRQRKASILGVTDSSDKKLIHEKMKAATSEQKAQLKALHQEANADFEAHHLLHGLHRIEKSGKAKFADQKAKQIAHYQMAFEAEKEASAMLSSLKPADIDGELAKYKAEAKALRGNHDKSNRGTHAKLHAKIHALMLAKGMHGHFGNHKKGHGHRDKKAS